MIPSFYHHSKMLYNYMLIICYCKNRILFLPWEELVQPKPKHPDHFCRPCLMRPLSVLQREVLLRFCRNFIWYSVGERFLSFKTIFHQFRTSWDFLLTERFYSLFISVVEIFECCWDFWVLKFFNSNKLRILFFEFWNFYSL